MKPFVPSWKDFIRRALAVCSSDKPNKAEKFLVLCETIIEDNVSLENASILLSDKNFINGLLDGGKGHVAKRLRSKPDFTLRRIEMKVTSTSDDVTFLIGKIANVADLASSIHQQNKELQFENQRLNKKIEDLQKLLEAQRVKHEKERAEDKKDERRKTIIGYVKDVGFFILGSIMSIAGGRILSKLTVKPQEKYMPNGKAVEIDSKDIKPVVAPTIKPRERPVPVEPHAKPESIKAPTKSELMPLKMTPYGLRAPVGENINDLFCANRIVILNRGGKPAYMCTRPVRSQGNNVQKTKLSL